MTCKRCHTQYKPEYDDEVCEPCGGTGVDFPFFTPCPGCFGVGIVSFDSGFCPACETIMRNILVK